MRSALLSAPMRDPIAAISSVFDEDVLAAPDIAGFDIDDGGVFEQGLMPIRERRAWQGQCQCGDGAYGP